MLSDVLLFFLFLGAINASFLYVWFKTAAFVEYMKLFGLGSFFKINEYLEVTQNDPGTNYPTYLTTNYNNFFTRLIGCPSCLGFWTSLFIAVPAFLILAFLSLWAIVAFPIGMILTYFFSLFSYGILVKVMKHE